MLQNIVIFLISSVLSFYIGAVVLRFLLAWARADFYNPFAQMIVKLTNPPLIKLRRLIPAVGQLDTAAIVLALALEIVLQLLIMLISNNPNLGASNIFGVFGLAVLSLARTVIWIYVVAIILLVIISWIGNRNGSPIYDLAETLVEPIMNPIRRYVPSFGGVDLSYFAALLGLQVILMILSAITI